jgi:hypothetical protein
LSVSKGEALPFHLLKCDRKKLNVVEANKICKVKILDRFGTLENLNDNVEVNTVLEISWKNIKISVKILDHYELKQHGHSLAENIQNFRLKEAG